MSFFRTRVREVVFLFVFLCASCAPVRRKTTHTTTPEKILQTLRARQKKINTVKGTARFRIYTAEGRQSSLVNVFMKKPAFVRLSFLNFLYQPVFYFVSNDTSLYLYPPDLSYVKLGNTSESTFSKLVGLAVPPNYIASLFMGKLPIGVLDADYALSYSDDEYILIGKMWEIRCDGEDFALKSLLKFNIRKEVVFRVTWAKWKHIDGVLFPMFIKISKPMDKTAIACKYRKILLNKAINTKTFFPSFPIKTLVYNVN